MRQFNIFRGMKGWLFMWERTIRWLHMRNEAEVRRRAKVLDFWGVHGDRATKDAFDVSRATLFRWQQALAQSRGRLDALDPKSTAPKRRRKRAYDSVYLERVIELRTRHHRIGKKKLAVLLGVSESYAGRTIADLKQRRLLPAPSHVSVSARTGKVIEHIRRKRRKLRRPQGVRVVEVDTVVRFVDGLKRYIVTAIDTETRFAFAGAYKNHSSASAADFLSKYRSLAPIPALQTDNGSEFAGYFDDACRRLSITRYHTYPRCPRMNGHVERFNRTLSEDFIQHHRAALRDDLGRFNEALVDWLLWYDTERPHQSLGMLPPLGYIVSTLSARESQRCWTNTTR